MELPQYLRLYERGIITAHELANWLLLWLSESERSDLVESVARSLPGPVREVLRVKADEVLAPGPLDRPFMIGPGFSLEEVQQMLPALTTIASRISECIDPSESSTP